MFGLWAPGSLPAGIAALPIALWEFSLGVWLVVKGFKPSPITAGMTAIETPHAYQGAPTRPSSRFGRARRASALSLSKGSARRLLSPPPN